MQRRYRMAARAGLMVLGAAGAIAIVIGAVTAIPNTSLFGRSEASPTQQASEAPATPSLSRSAATSAAPALQPIIPEGRKDLGDSVYAERSGPMVTVNFDTELLRTRFDWKFEGVVRGTLPLVFGQEARAALDSVPSGQLVRGGSLIDDLPTRGIALAVSGNRSIRIWPITRPGRDGPLVVAYKASASATK